MNIFERLRNLFRRDTVTTPLVPGTSTALLSSLSDVAEDAGRRKSELNRGVFWRLLDIRASSMYDGLRSATVEREVSQSESEEVEADHPWYQLLRTPSRQLNRFVFWYTVFMLRDSVGEAYAHVERNALGVPVNLRLILPEYGFIVPVVNEFGDIERYEFIRNDGRSQSLQLDEVIRIYRPRPQNPILAMSLVEAAVLELEESYWQRIYSRDMARDGQAPPGYLTTEQELSPTLLAEYAKQFKAHYMGGRRAGRKLPALAGGLELKATPFKATDLQLIEGRDMTLDELFYITGVPRGLLTDKANRANAEASRYTFLTITIQKELNAICEGLTQEFERIFRADPGRLGIYAPDMTPTDRLQQAEIDRLLLGSGLVTINELRRRDGYEPYDIQNADEPLINAGLVPLSMSGL